MKVGIMLAVVAAAFATAATSADARSKPNRISIAYVVPKNPAHQPIYEQLKENRALERLQEFLSPFRLPRTLKITVAGCDGDADAFYADDLITICYEYIAELSKRATAGTAASGVTPIDAIIGPLYDSSLHEFSHALFDILDLPVLGREEDAADLVGAYIYLQLGKSEARRLIMGAVSAYKAEADGGPPPSLKHFADEHGTPAQRAFNLLCLAYGADPKLFADVASKEYLPKKRLEACDDEYNQIAEAFETLISPHVDRALAKKVLDKSWLPEPTTRPRRSTPARPSQQ